MCNRYRMSEKDRAVAEAFGVVVPPDLSWPNPELFPRREGLVVRSFDTRFDKLSAAQDERLFDTRFDGLSAAQDERSFDTRFDGLSAAQDERVLRDETSTSPASPQDERSFGMLSAAQDERKGGRVLDVMRWGFPPPAVKPGERARAPVTNVRNLASPFWRGALGRPDRRCLVPATSFCEWEGEKGAKLERWFSLSAAPIFAFAGVWRPVEVAQGQWERAFAFLTCDPNPLVAPIHPKAMPVILHPEDYDRWLRDPYANACELAQPFPSQLMAVA